MVWTLGEQCDWQLFAATPFEITSATAETSTTIHVLFNREFDAVTVEVAASWTVEPVALGATVVVLSAVADDDDLGIVLTVSSQLTGGQQYRVTAAPTVLASDSSPLSVDSATFAVSTALVDMGAAEFPLGLLDSFLLAVGREVQQLAGRPTTMLTGAFDVGDVVLQVESTLGFPDSGSVWLQGQKFTFTGKVSGALYGMATVNGERQLQSIPARTLAVFDVTSWAPPAFTVPTL